MLSLLRSLAWLACIVYSTIPAFWLLIHWRVEYWRSRRWSPFAVIVPLWVVTWMLVRAVSAPWRHVVLYRSIWLWIPAAALFILGFWIYHKAGLNFGKHQLYGLSELKPENAEQRLATTGIRARVRHPVYLGHLCEMLAWSLGSGMLVCYALTVLAIVTGAVMIRREDAELENRFGDSFREYQKSVPAMFPKL